MILQKVKHEIQEKEMLVEQLKIRMNDADAKVHELISSFEDLCGTFLLCFSFCICSINLVLKLATLYCYFKM